LDKGGCPWKKCASQSGNKTVVNYNGRGYIHLSTEGNYRLASWDLYNDDRLVKDPDLVAYNRTVAWQTAFWFWNTYVHSKANTNKFGLTIAMIWGKDNCENPVMKANFVQLFKVYKCVLKHLAPNETANEEGCYPLDEIHKSVAEKQSGPIFIYIGIAVGLLIFIILIMLIVIWKLKRSKKEIQNSQFILDQFRANSVTEKDLEDLGYRPCFEFPIERLIFEEELGVGFFGCVVKAKAIGLKRNEAFTTVAVKRVKEAFDNTQTTALLAELKIFLSLGRHINIVNFLGAVTKNCIKGELMLIFEYCEYGNLKDFLISSRYIFVNQMDEETQEYDAKMNKRAFQLTEKAVKTQDLICYSFQIAQGMQYLHSRKILHRDLALRNVLLSEGNVVKLCDFGLAKNVYNYGDYCTTNNKQLPIKWMSIEAIKDKIFTMKNDVWAFGIVLWEIFSLGADPYPGLPIDENFLNKLVGGYRMERPDKCPLTIYNYMLLCWQQKAENRPDFNVLSENLRVILDKSTSNYYLQLNDSYVTLFKI
ncbi:VEGF receptor-like protein, partial [Dinothrombium tinctorium]